VLNRKLTKVIAGRVVQSANYGDGVMHITFTEGSKVTIKTGADNTPSRMENKTVLKVRQSGELMSLDFTDNTSAEIKLAEATSSVILRDGKGQLEYAD
jgi:hypothetical protein